MRHWQWFRRILTRLGHQFRLLVRGISGADRREKQRLMRKLATLRAEYNLLSRRLAEVRHQRNLENQDWQTRFEEMRVERDDLQLEIWELENLIEELFELLTSVEALAPSVESMTSSEKSPVTLALAETQPSDQTSISIEETFAGLAAVDLSGLKLALVGGHASTRRGVICELSEQHGLTRWVELPPFSKHSLGRSNIKAKIHDCDLIVLITGYMKHKQTDSVMQLRKLGALPGEVLLLNCRGKSGVVREILTYISQKNC
ncbi:MAG: hypothetical protein AAFY67_19065 [Cyanobacteria bacterium J06642_9]